MNARTRILLVPLVLVLVLGSLARMPATASAGEQQALIATIKLRSGDMGSPDERARIVTLENQLSDAIKNSAVKSLMATSTAMAFAIYMYGPSADRLLTVTLPSSRSSELQQVRMSLKGTESRAQNKSAFP
jgi:hypothetical protein